MKYIIIGTTSLNRPELHNDNIREWIDWIKKDNDYEFVWFINIDMIEQLESTYEETMDNYKKIINGDIEQIYFLKNPENKGNFLQACKRLVTNMNDFINQLVKTNSNIDLQSDIKIFWFEDDWKFNVETNLSFKFLIENFSTKSSHINLSFIRNNYIWALAPGIISYNLWYKLFYKGWTEQLDNIDPEHCLGLYFLNNYTNNSSKKKTPDIKNITNLTVINLKINEKYFEKDYLTKKNSFYTYYDDKWDIDNTRHNYIKISDIKNKFEQTDLFIRISPTVVIDGCLYGRKFMEKLYIFKKGISSSSDINFYEFKK